MSITSCCDVPYEGQKRLVHPVCRLCYCFRSGSELGHHCFMLFQPLNMSFASSAPGEARCPCACFLHTVTCCSPGQEVEGVCWVVIVHRMCDLLCKVKKSTLKTAVTCFHTGNAGTKGRSDAANMKQGGMRNYAWMSAVLVLLL